MGSDRPCAARLDGFSFAGEDLSVPHCVVDTIRVHSVLVKCGCVTSDNLSGDEPTITYTPLAFNFIAVGPV